MANSNKNKDLGKETFTLKNPFNPNSGAGIIFTIIESKGSISEDDLIKEVSKEYKKRNREINERLIKSRIYKGVYLSGKVDGILKKEKGTYFINR
jgi:hypothetical protein